MKKRMTAMLMCIVMVFAAGCGSSDASGDTSADTSADASADAETTTEKPDYDALDYVILGEYLGIEVESILYTASDEEYEETILSLLEANSYYDESDKTEVEDGDVVNIDYIGYLDGEAFDGGSDEGYDLEIGSDTFVDGFEDQLIGLTVGETVDIDITFPDSYSSETLAGQDTVFTVTINYICEEVVPEYTDEFVVELTDGEYTTTADFDEYVWDYLEDAAAETTQSALDNVIQEAVLEICEITSIPDGLVDYYVSVYYAQDSYYAEYYGLEFETYISIMYSITSEDDYFTALAEEVTEDLIPVYLIQEAIIEDAEIEVTDEAIENFMEEYAEYYGYDDVDSLLSYYSCTTTADFIELVGEDSFNNSVMDMMVWDMIEEAAVITYVEDGTSDSE